MHGTEGVVNHRRTGHDAIEIPGKALRLNEALQWAGNAWVASTGVVFVTCVGASSIPEKSALESVLHDSALALTT